MKYLIPLALSTCIVSNANAYEYNWDAWSYTSNIQTQSGWNEVMSNCNTYFAANGWGWNNWLLSFEQAVHKYAMDNDNTVFSTNGTNIINNAGSGTPSTTAPNYSTDTTTISYSNLTGKQHQWDWGLFSG